MELLAALGVQASWFYGLEFVSCGMHRSNSVGGAWLAIKIVFFKKQFEPSDLSWLLKKIIVILIVKNLILIHAL